MPEIENREVGERRLFVLFVVVAALFFVNDFVFFAAKTELQWLAADYSFKFLALIIIYFSFPLRDCVKNSIVPSGIRVRPAPVKIIETGALILLSFLTMIAIEFLVRVPLLDVIPDTRQFRYPAIQNVSLYWFDLTVGLVLTATSEEFVFRSIAKGFITQFTKRPIIILIVSSVIFALNHWSHGVPNVIAAFLSGVILMALYLRTRSIIPSVITHYAINVWHFA